ncbi:hypothetical protein, partial [Amycolatopsis samaneae]
EVGELVDDAVREVGFTPAGGAAIEQALCLLATRAVAGTMTPPDFAAWADVWCGFDTPLAERLVALCREYDVLEYPSEARYEVDARVLAEARRLAAEWFSAR